MSLKQKFNSLNLKQKGGTAVDAVEQAIRIFEQHGHFNAGRGSCLNTSGEVECDAMIMDGNNMKTGKYEVNTSKIAPLIKPLDCRVKCANKLATGTNLHQTISPPGPRVQYVSVFSFDFEFLPGAVTSARHFPHPVSIARKIMDKSPHCALSGEGALEFALSLGNFDEICVPGDLKSDDFPHQQIHVRNQQFEQFTDFVYVGRPIVTEWDRQALNNAGAVAEGQLGERRNHPGHDTVSAVAIDCNGRLACANSTGM